MMVGTNQARGGPERKVGSVGLAAAILYRGGNDPQQAAIGSATRLTEVTQSISGAVLACGRSKWLPWAMLVASVGWVCPCRG